MTGFPIAMGIYCVRLGRKVPPEKPGRIGKYLLFVLFGTPIVASLWLIIDELDPPIFLIPVTVVLLLAAGFYWLKR